MTKTRIGIDTNKENEYRIRIEAKINAFRTLLDYCQQFVLIDDLNAFSDNPNEYFKTAFNTKYENDFPPIVSYSKRLELFSRLLPYILPKLKETDLNTINENQNPNEIRVNIIKSD